MPRERSLLERLAEPDPPARRSAQEDLSRLVDSVLANLRRVLNSRHGITMIREDYGIPDLADVVHNLPEALGKMRAAIKTAIENYEPRLSHVRVKSLETPSDDLLVFRFQIMAQLVTSESGGSVRFETRIDPTGEVSLRG